MGRGYGDGERGRLYTYRYTVTTRMTPALRWAAKRAIWGGVLGVGVFIHEPFWPYGRGGPSEPDLKGSVSQHSRTVEMIIIDYGAPSRKSSERLQRYKDTLISSHTHTHTVQRNTTY